MGKRIFRLGIALVSLVLLLNLWVPSAAALTDEQKLVSEVWRIVDRAYVDDTFNHQNWWLVRQKALKKPMLNHEDAYTTIQEMLATLEDPYTRLLKPDQYRSLQTNTSGELTGVGLQISQDAETGALWVIAPIEGSPAESAGLRPRDRILKINGTPTLNLSLDEAAERMRGVVGSLVTLTIAREGEADRDVNLKRDRITLNPVYADLRTQSNGLKVGYIRLSQFNANAAMEVGHAIGKLEEKGANAYVLDLRNNPGGLLQSGIDIARLWLNDGTIVYTVNREGIQDSFIAGERSLTQDPLVVLVNQGTASASEILSGALQDNGRAKLVGERTFGKGLIQSLFNLSDGSGLAVTIARYETPSHRDINRQGIEPDQVVPLDLIAPIPLGEEKDPQYQAAIDLLSQQGVVAEVE